MFSASHRAAGVIQIVSPFSILPSSFATRSRPNNRTPERWIRYGFHSPERRAGWNCRDSRADGELARLATTLIHQMARAGASRGIASLCVGVGQGLATVFERE